MCMSGIRPLGQRNEVTVNDVNACPAEVLDKKLLYSEEALEKSFRKE